MIYMYLCVNMTTYLFSLNQGAVLVFLSGYDDVALMRDKLAGDRVMAESNKFIILTLHSAMQSTDLKKIFKSPPSGTRKIVSGTIA